MQSYATKWHQYRLMYQLKLDIHLTGMEKTVDFYSLISTVKMQRYANLTTVLRKHSVLQLLARNMHQLLYLLKDAEIDLWLHYVNPSRSLNGTENRKMLAQRGKSTALVRMILIIWTQRKRTVRVDCISEHMVKEYVDQRPTVRYTHIHVTKAFGWC